jgi:ABC-type multidrug transport system fused ATPase/permease subunit
MRFKLIFKILYFYLNLFRFKDSWETPENTNLPKAWPEMGAIKFIDYSVKYRDDLDFVLKNINCDIKPSEKIGIVGRTGYYNLAF